MRVCSVEGCSKKHLARGLCSLHYDRLRYKRRSRNPAFMRIRRAQQLRSFYRRRDKFREEPALYLRKKYSEMKSRVRGTGSRNSRRYYKGLPIMTKQDFIESSLKDVDFMHLFREWGNAGFALSLTPVPDRLDSEDGYVWKNIEWVTFSENARRAAELYHSRRAA